MGAGEGPFVAPAEIEVVGGREIESEAGAEPKHEENTSEETSAVGNGFAEGDDEKREGHLATPPGGGVAATGGDDEAGLTLCKIGATGLNRCPFVSKEQSACLGGKAAGSRIGVSRLGVDPAWGDEVVAAPKNIAFGGDG